MSALLPILRRDPAATRADKPRSIRASRIVREELIIEVLYDRTAHVYLSARFLGPLLASPVYSLLLKDSWHAELDNLHIVLPLHPLLIRVQSVYYWNIYALVLFILGDP